VAIGELEEGPWWWAQVAGAEPEDMTEGQALTIDFQHAGPEELLPVFLLARS
jgi:hypothetical protein